jgi:recombinational DNA repair ATPase RecF
MKTLSIGEIQIPKGFRILVPQSVELLKKVGVTVVNGGSGQGKSSLLEVMKLATQGKDSLRDNYFVREGEDESEIAIQIASEEDAALNFFIIAKAKKSGEVQYSFKVEKDGKLKTTKSLPEIGEITPSKLFDMISTTLTYGAADFMSENPKTVREFIFKTYPEVRDIAKQIEDQINEAVKERDRITEQQSAIGAYANKLDDKVCPEYIDMAALMDKRRNAIDALAQAKADDKAYANNAQEKVATKEQELENVKLKAGDVKRRIAEWNQAKANKANLHTEQLRSRAVELSSALTTLTSTYSVFHPKSTLKEAQAFFKAEVSIVEEAFEAAKNRPEPFQIPENPKSTEMPDEESKGLVEELESLRKQYVSVESELKSLRESENPENPNSNVAECERKLSLIDVEIQQAEESNDLWTKFSVYNQHKEAHEKVLKLRAERNKLYEGIDTGVKGLQIQVTDEAGTMLGFFYNGAYNPDYFGNTKGDFRPLTSYSKGQKTLVAAMLQCFLMKRKPYALNVVCIDDTGMDSVIYELYDKFATKFGLLMFVTNTNDKKANDLREGEILMEGGEVYVKR